MFTTNFSFYEKCENGDFSQNSHDYRLETDSFPEPQEINDLLFEAAEIDCYNGEVLLDYTVELDGEYYDSDSCVFIFSIVRTNIPSSYFIWGSKTPTVFEVDRSKSRITMRM